jgi:hypothetical protein
LGYKEFDTEDDEESSINYKKFYRESMKDLDRKLFVKIDSIISKF